MSTKLFAMSFLLALAASRPTVSERGIVNTECWQTNPGTVFYNCANGYKGCFTKDPCSLPPLSSATSPSYNSNIPVSTRPATTTPPFYNSTIPVSTKPATTTPPFYNSTIPVSTKPATTTPPSYNSTIPVSTKPSSTTTPYKNSTSPVSTMPASTSPVSTKPTPIAPSSTMPAPNVPLTSCAQSPVQGFEIVNPRSFNIYHADAERRATQDQVPHVDLNKPAGSDITTTNAIVFDNVPAGAKNCRLNWRSVANGGPLRFIVDGEGQAFTRQLLGFPAIGEKVSDDSLAKFRDSNAKWSKSLDFQGWTVSTSHAGPVVNCASQVAIEVKGSDCGEGENRVQLSISETSGFYLSYDL